MNIATVSSSSASIRTSTQSDIADNKNSLFASLFKESKSPDADKAEDDNQLNHLLNSIKDLLQFDVGKRPKSDHMRTILPIVFRKDPNVYMHQHKNGEQPMFPDGSTMALNAAQSEEQLSDILKQLETILPMLTDKGITNEKLIDLTEDIQNLLNVHQDEEIPLSEEQLSDILSQLEAATSMLKEDGIGSGNLINVLDDLDQHLHVNKGEYLSHVLEQIENIKLTLDNGDLTTEEIVNLVKKLETILTEIPEEIKLSNELMGEMTSILSVLEEKLSEQNPDQNLSQMTFRFNGSSFQTEEMEGSSRRLSIIKDFQNVSKQAHDLIEEVVNEKQTVKINKQLAELLEQAKQFKQEFTSLEEDETTEGKKSEVEKIWSNLQSMYDKRTSMNKGGAYVENAKVRSTDIGSWLQHMVSETNASQTQPNIQLQQQMTPVEQYVMHVRTQEGTGLQNEDLMQQLKQIMNQSALGRNQVFKQLSITIQPEQLGEMTIRLVQIEGELIAKITVTSQAAKSALESNLQQLKNMFAPHQVMIEKQDGDDQTSVDQDNKKEDQHEPSNEHEEEDQTDDKNERSFQDQFEQILEETVGDL